MRENQSSNRHQQTTTLNQIRPMELEEFMPPFPFQFYSPYWNYPFYNYSAYAPDKFGLDRCRQCRIIPIATTGTQTEDLTQSHSQQPEGMDQLAENNALQQENIPEIVIVKQEQKLQEAMDFKEIDSQKSPSKQSQSQGEKQLFCNKTTTNALKDNVFQQMLTKYLNCPEEYESLIEEYIKGDCLFSQLVKYFHQKLSSFKKSKQEMIKLIIRKTQRHYKVQNNCKKDERFKKFGGFKSMNSVYLQKLFSDPAFARSYNIVFKTFIEDFEKESMQKLDAFVEKICCAGTFVEFKAAMKVLDEKNKMPWPAFWIEKLRRVAWEIKTNYINENILDEPALKKRAGR